METEKIKYCKYCGKKIPEDAVICCECGRQVEELKQSRESVIINNNVTNQQPVYGRTCNKWIALVLCVCFGYFGAHKFYEGKIGTGLIYLFTFGLFGIGWVIDIIITVCRPIQYYP